MVRLAFTLGAIVLASGTCQAQAIAPDDTREVVQNLVRRIEQLEKRVAELEGRELPPSVHAPEPPASVPLAPQQLAEEYPSLKIRGFADVSYSSTDQPGDADGFSLGQFILHFSSRLSSQIAVFAETSITARSTGFVTDVERASIRYDQSDYFKVSLGRYHTPINYWNTAFHHGPWLQTTISRPEMIRFGGRLLPVHFLGMLVEGNLPSGGVHLRYDAGFGNGRGTDPSRPGDSGDANGHRAWLVALASKPGGAYGLEVGGALYRDAVPVGPGLDVGEWIASAHVAWTREKPELLAEFSNIRHDPPGGGPGLTSRAYYVQAAYRLPWGEQAFKPYYRFDRINTPPGQPILDVPDLFEHTVGIRYDLSEFAAFKAEYRNTRPNRRDPSVNGFFAQTSFTF